MFNNGISVALFQIIMKCEFNIYNSDGGFLLRGWIYWTSPIASVKTTTLNLKQKSNKFSFLQYYDANNVYNGCIRAFKRRTQIKPFKR